MITRRANVFFSFLFSLLLVACGGSGSGAGDTVVDFLRAIERDDQEQMRELVHRGVNTGWDYDVTTWAEGIADRDGIDSIRVVSEQALELEVGSAGYDVATVGGQIQRVETRITFGDGSQLEETWILAMTFERYRVLWVPRI